MDRQVYDLASKCYFVVRFKSTKEGFDLKEENGDIRIKDDTCWSKLIAAERIGTEDCAW